MERSPIKSATPAIPPDLEESSATELFNKTAASLANKNRALKVLRHCNQVMFQAETEQELLNEICRIVVKDTGYLLTWIGYPKLDEHKTIRPMAYCGYEDGYLESLVVSWDDSDRGHGPAGSVIRTRKPYVVRNVHTDPNFLPWREAAIERGYAAVAAFPLFINEQLPSVILMYAAEAEAFNSEELELLVHFAETLSYGITSMRLKEKNRHIESSLRDSEQRFRFMFDTSPIAVRIAIDNNTSVVYANPSYNQLMNTDAEQVLGLNPGDFYADKDEYIAIVNELEQGLTVKNRLVKLSIPKQGSKWTLSTYLPVQFEGENA
ncbi:MAG: GAF domain-containing protein, partial [Proteobacteria bacterium]|nr:GAF domain-containing protein [Pseudomonadota bacterium]